MNRIILIGNGFDLAHGLKTRYNDFIDWVFDKEMQIIQENFKCIESKLLELRIKNLPYKNKFSHSHLSSFDEFCDKLSFNKQYLKYGVYGYTKLVESYKEADMTLIVKNKFLEEIIKPNQDRNWYDIEESYYDLLLMYVREEETITKDSKSKKAKVSELHRDFKQIKDLLEEYLTIATNDFNENNMIGKIYRYIYSPVRIKDLGTKAVETIVQILTDKQFDFIKNIKNNDDNDKYDFLLKEILRIYPNFKSFSQNEFRQEVSSILHNSKNNFLLPLESILMLNFNYTKIGSSYFEDPYENLPAESIHIHGKLNNTENPIIFGYGDEVDESYTELENLNDNEYLENIKSIQYSNTNNYKRLLNYINSDEYQVFILGHSCGLSDRTMLNTIFEHENCVSIKPFYYKPKEGNDKYSNTVMNISRHFNDKAKMRDLVVNKTFCEVLPQIEKEN